MRSAHIDGTKVKAAREAAGFTQEQLAREIGVSVFTVSRWERGTTTRISIARLFSVCLALNVDPDALLADGEEVPE